MVIAEQAVQLLTTSHLPVRTADAFFRYEGIFTAWRQSAVSNLSVGMVSADRRLIKLVCADEYIEGTTKINRKKNFLD